jgi:uncharacterized protein (TIRG00374 family)
MALSLRHGAEGNPAMWRVLIKAAISIALMWLLLSRQKSAAILGQLGGINLGALLAAIVLSAALVVALSLRWSAILGTLSSPRGLSTTLPMVFTGLFFSQVLPSSIGGDVARMWLARNGGIRLSVAVSSVMVDRLSGLLPLLVLATAALPALFEVDPGRSVTGGTMLVLVAAYCGFAVALMLDQAPTALDRFKLVRGFRRIAVDARATLLRPRVAAKVLGYSFLNQFGNVLVVFILAQGLRLNVSAPACLFVVPLANLVQTVPISIAGWGVREGFFVAGFGLFGVAASDALALSVAFGVIGIAISLPGGVLWLKQKREGKEPSLTRPHEPAEISPS